VVVASDEWAKQNGKSAIATVLAYGQVADDFGLPIAKDPTRRGGDAGALEKIGKQPWRRRPLGDQRGLRLRRHQLGMRMLEIDEGRGQT